MKRFIEKAIQRIDVMDKEEIKRLLAQQLEEQEMRDAVLDSYNAGFLLVNEEKKILYCNKPIRKLIPTLNEKDYYGIEVLKFIKDKQITDFLKQIFMLKQNNEKTKEFTYTVGGELKIIRATLFPNFTTLKNEYCCLIRFNDVTAEKVQAAKYSRSENLASMTTMAAGVAHEIKNPLASISIYLQLLDKKFDKQKSLTKMEADKYLSVINEEIDRLNSIVVDFLFAVKPLNINLSKENINDLIKTLVAFVKPELENKNISIETDLSMFLPTLDVDGALFRQATLNLITNSAYAIQQQNYPPNKGKIIISTQQVEDNVQIIFSDNGSGMTSDQMSKIFQPYYTTKDTGTGLGLTVFYKIIKELKGDISVNSEINKGTSFVILLPIPSSERKKLEHKNSKEEK